MNIFLKILYLLDPKGKRQAICLIPMVLAMAVLDVIGIASVMPFMAVLANPDLVEINAYLNLLFRVFNFNSVDAFLYFLGVMVFVMLIITLAFKAITNYFLFQFALRSEYRIGSKLIEGYLGQPYAWFLHRNGSSLGKNLLSEVNAFIMSGLLPMVLVIANGCVVILTVIFIFIVDYQLALFIGLFVCLLYALMFKSTNSLLSRIGLGRLKANEQRFLAVNELFGAIKEVKVQGLENIYLKRFRSPSKIYSGHQAKAMVVAQLPRFGLEALAFGGLVVVILYLMDNDGDLARILPIMSVYAFAAYRLMPGIQAVYSGMSQIFFARPVVDSLYLDLKECTRSQVQHSFSNQLDFKHVLDLRGISYKYPESKKSALHNINLTILQGSKVAIVGPTGSGKTTLIDIILGLLEVESGQIKVDGVKLDKDTARSWQSFLGYVPQNIYLTDDTICANIAFGQSSENIDLRAVELAAKRANLHDFIIGNLPLGYHTFVGERGVRLSGGQRQRIGIARALYRNPKLLILDEATSALDNLTERSVMDSVYAIENITVVIIAHRLTTIKDCDKILFLKDARAVATGTFDELIQKSSDFRSLAIDEKN